MHYQEVQVKYLKQSNVFNLTAIPNLSSLRQAIALAFNSLPDHYIVNLDGQQLTEDRLHIIKETQLNDFTLQIQAKDVQEIQSLISDVSKISILQENKYSQPIQQKYFKKQDQQDRNQSKEIDESDVLNEDIQCNGCFAFPIKGVIYKCIVCQDYDLCCQCQKSKHQFHPLLKITQKGCYPMKLQVVFSKKSQKKMEKLAQLDRINDQRAKRANYHPQVQQYSIIDPSELKSTKICAPNFLSSIMGKGY